MGTSRKFTVDEILQATGGVLLKGISKVVRLGISTDTRTIENDEIYLPLKGSSFDGENFLQKAIDGGAFGCFVTKDKYPVNAQIVIKVENTLTAYLELAKFYKEEINPDVIAITGSSGKTTTKEILYSVVKKKFKTHKTFSNHNNEIGLCQTILSMPKDTQVLILEMGMRGLGEIELLSKYSEPDYAIITNVGTAHIGRLGSEDNIAIAKCEIVKYLQKDGVLIAHNDERVKRFVDFRGDKIFYSIADVQIIEKKSSYSKFVYKEKEYELSVEGDYNIENSLSVIELAYQLGLTYEEIRNGLYEYKPIEKRWEVISTGKFNIINDSYNANPESMKAAVSTFIELYENPVVVLGDMGELGSNEADYHSQVGEYFAQKVKGVSNVKFLTVGNLAQHIAKALENSDVWVKSFDDNAQAACYILDNMNVDNTIFLKASRTMKFEEIINNLRGDN